MSALFPTPEPPPGALKMGDIVRRLPRQRVWRSVIHYVEWEVVGLPTGYGRVSLRSAKGARCRAWPTGVSRVKTVEERVAEKLVTA